MSRLFSWGVHRYFGYPGDGINGMTSALQRTNGRAQFIQVRHEETAGFAASAHVKYGGGPLGCALVTSGPGAIHLLNGLYDAKLDHQPVVALVGHTATTAEGGGYYQEVDLLALYKDVAAAFLAQLDHPAQVRHLVDRACRTALARRTVTALILPLDLQDEPAVPNPPHAHGYYHTSNAPSSTPTVPPEADVRRAAEVLRGGQRVAMLVGQGALGARDEVRQIADRLGAGVATALLGFTAVDHREPWVTGAIGLLGTRPSWQLMSGCDRLLIVGSNMPYSEFYPPPGQARAVQIDLDGTQLGLRYPTEVNLTGDARPTLRALLNELGPGPGPTAWRAEVAEATSAWRRVQRDLAEQTADPVNPQLLFHTLNERLPDDVHARGRLRHHHRLVRPPHPGTPQHAGQPLRHPAVHGRRHAVRAERQVRPPGPAAGRADRRRRHADERRQRADHRGEVLAQLGRPALRGAGAQQPGSGVRQLGTALHRGDADVPGQPAVAGHRLPPVGGGARAATAS